MAKFNASWTLQRSTTFHNMTMVCLVCSDVNLKDRASQKLGELLNPANLALDRQYSLYSAERSTFQQTAGANLGKVS